MVEDVDDVVDVDSINSSVKFEVTERCTEFWTIGVLRRGLLLQLTTDFDI
jgi:hypothetical protein